GWLGRRTGRENRRSGAGGLTFEQSAELLLPVIARECLVGFQQGSWVSLRALARWYIGVAFGVGEFLPAILEPLLKGLRGRGDQQEDQRGEDFEPLGCGKDHDPLLSDALGEMRPARRIFAQLWGCCGFRGPASVGPAIASRMLVSAWMFRMR